MVIKQIRVFFKGLYLKILQLPGDPQGTIWELNFIPP